MLDNYLVKDPDNFEAGILYGVAEMQNGNLFKAEETFKAIINDDDNLLLDSAHWYLALCYIRSDEREKAISQLESIINTNSGYREKAKRILKKIR